jgi:hypothetical protein
MALNISSLDIDTKKMDHSRYSRGCIVETHRKHNWVTKLQSHLNY